MRGQLCWVGNRAVWEDGKQRGRRGEDEWKRIAEDTQTRPAATRSGASLDPGVWKSFRNKNWRTRGKQKEEKKDGIKNIYKGVIPRRIFFLGGGDCEKAPLILQWGLLSSSGRGRASVKAGSSPGDRFLLKPEKEKRDCFMEGKERNTHMDICRCQEREEWINIYLKCSQRAHVCSQLFHISTTYYVYF